MPATVKLVLLAGRLHRVAALGAPSNRKDIPRIVPTPVIECTAPSIKRHVYLILTHLVHRCTANQLGVFLIDRLQLLADLKQIALRGRWFRYKDVTWCHNRSV
uniref:Putative secreted protein n=1 Tax=Anopheles marajoara TaxID=58244 RepID=A0A2M4C8K9_9DIPT